MGAQQALDPILSQPHLLADALLGPAQAPAAVGEVGGEVVKGEPMEGNVQSIECHWNTVILDGTVADDEVQEWIEHSYDLVVAKLPRHRRDALLPYHPGV